MWGQIQDLVTGGGEGVTHLKTCHMQDGERFAPQKSELRRTGADAAFTLSTLCNASLLLRQQQTHLVQKNRGPVTTHACFSPDASRVSSPNSSHPALRDLPMDDAEFSNSGITKTVACACGFSPAKMVPVIPVQSHNSFLDQRSRQVIV